MIEMGPRTKVAGIYDIETLKFLKQENVDSFGVDLRPKSFNFLQHHKLIEMLPLLDGGDQLYLNFQDEANIVIEKFINDIKSECDRQKVNFKFENLLLEFQGIFKPEVWNGFGIPFSIHWQQDYFLKDLEKIKNFSGISVSESLLVDIYRQGDFYKFLERVMKLKKLKPELIISYVPEMHFQESKMIPDDPEILNDILLHFPFSHLIFLINAQVEECYRRPNYKLLKKIIAQNVMSNNI